MGPHENKKGSSSKGNNLLGLRQPTESEKSFTSYTAGNEQANIQNLQRIAEIKYQGNRTVNQQMGTIDIILGGCWVDGQMLCYSFQKWITTYLKRGMDADMKQRKLFYQDKWERGAVGRVAAEVCLGVWKLLAQLWLCHWYLPACAQAYGFLSVLTFWSTQMWGLNELGLTEPFKAVLSDRRAAHRWWLICVLMQNYDPIGWRC